MSTPVSDYALRFSDEAASFAVAIALDAVVMTEEGPRLARFTHRYALDVIGEIQAPTGELDAEGNAILATVPGWHVNFRILDGSPLPAELEAFVVTPELPARVWA